MKSDFEKHKGKPEYNDIFMTRIGSVGVTNILKTNGEYSYYVSLALLKPYNINPDFLNQNMKTDKFQREVWKRKIHVAFPQKINLGDISKCVISFPKTEEQNKIASFLSLVDKRIELQVDKINKLEEYKKGMMQKIFSQEIRFKNTKGEEYPEWVKIKLCSALKERNEKEVKNKELKHLSLTKEGVVDKAERYERDFLVRTENKKYKVTRLNDICYNPANLKFGVICRNKLGDGIFSLIYVTYLVKNNFLPKYMEYFLCRNNFINKIIKYEEGTVYERMAVKSSDFLKHKRLNSETEKENRLSDKLNQLKKGLLQQMFL